MRRRPAASLRLALVLSFGVAATSPTLAQTQLPVEGTVVTTDGQPLGGVVVYSGYWKHSNGCYSPDQVTTNDRGRFRLEHPGHVMHFERDDLQPLALVIPPGVSEFRVVMGPSKDEMVVPKCRPPKAGEKLMGMSRFSPQFSVPARNVKVSGGLDVDYVRYVVKPDNGKSQLELLFGFVSDEASDDLFVESADFSQRYVRATGKEFVGMDSWGHLRNGAKWRHTSVRALQLGLAAYQDASREEAELFDQIINSVCTVR